jgi:hypothetical protein
MRCSLKGMKQGVPSRVWNKVCPQGPGTRFALRVWNKAFPQGHGTRCALNSLELGIPQGFGTRCAPKGLERGVPSRAWSVLLRPQNTVYLSNTDAISHSPHFCIFFAICV